MSKRSYRQNCALAHTIDLVGERWTFLIVRDLLTGPKRYRDLEQSLAGIGTNLLATRLRELEQAGIVAKEKRNSGGHRYALTEPGRALEPAVLALVRWGLVHGPRSVRGYGHREEWDLVALKATFRPDRAASLDLTVNFVADQFEGRVLLLNGEMHYGIGPDESPDLVVNGTIEDLFLTKNTPADLLAAGRQRDLNQFMDCFAL